MINSLDQNKPTICLQSNIVSIIVLINFLLYPTIFIIRAKLPYCMRCLWVALLQELLVYTDTNRKREYDTLLVNE